MRKRRVVILLAGDEPQQVSDLTARLQAEGFRVVHVSDQASVVTIARSQNPNIILLDLKSCFATCRQLKRNFLTAPIPIVAILFPAEEVDRVAALELGADDCIAKPFSFRELTLRIRCSLNRARNREGTARYEKSQHYSALTRRSSRSKPD